MNRSATRKPVGILHVNVVRASKLLKMDILGTSDPYVKLSLSGGGLPAKKTSIKMRNLNPVWNEKFKLIVNDPKSQVLQLQVYDWDKVFPSHYLFRVDNTNNTPHLFSFYYSDNILKSPRHTEVVVRA